MTKYDSIYKFGEDVKNRGYNYDNKILKNSLSKYLYQDEKMKGFLDVLEVAVTKLYNSTKRIKHYFNFTVEENEIENLR